MTEPQATLSYASDLETLDILTEEQDKEAAYVDDSDDDDLNDLRLEREVDEIVRFVFGEESGEEDYRDDEHETDMDYDT